MGGLCQSCEEAPFEVTEMFGDPADPYMICRMCRDRLLSHSLRPREWYNLCAIHGQANDLLDDAHYGEDGTALQPSEPVTHPELFPYPALQQEQNSPERLLTYILAVKRWHEGHWFIDDHLIAAMKSHSPDVMLPAIRRRLDIVKNEEVIWTIFQLAGLVLGSTGAPLVRDQWERFASTNVFSGIAFAAARCLPLEEGYRKVMDKLSKMDIRKRYAIKYVLEWFETPLTLDWIEENACSPVDVTWGPLAACSKFDWERAKKWLSAGRPLSLIALDALRGCICDPRRPRLLNPPHPNEFISTLNDYLNKDNVPRVRERVSDLLVRAEDLRYQ
jgi:hypothetical protein